MFSAPAHALLLRGHTFEVAIGAGLTAEGGGKLSQPSGVAVNETAPGVKAEAGAGDIYVLDTGNNRVVRLSPEHKFLEAWGYGVNLKAPSGGFELCKAECGPGVAGFSADQFDAPIAIAVDNAPGSPSKGDVYVVADRSWKHAVVDKFTANGEPLGTLPVTKAEEQMIDGVAVAQDGSVWIDREDEDEEVVVEHFTSAAHNALIDGESFEEVGFEGPVRPGLAVDAGGQLYVTYEPGGADAAVTAEEEEEIGVREKERKKAKEELKHELPQQPCTVHKCFVAQFATIEEEEGKFELEPVSFQLDGQNATGVGIDLTGGASGEAVYVAHGGSVAAFTLDGELIQTLTEELGDGGASGVAVNARTDELLVVDAAAATVDVFAPAKPGPPVIEAGSVSAGDVAATTARLQASVDPNGAEPGASEGDTHVRLQYGVAPFAAGTTSCSGCSEAPTPPEDIGGAFGDQRVSVPVGGLAPSTTYHVRAVAENAFAKGAGATISPEVTFTTASAAGEAVLPDSRRWELVSPPEKHGASVDPIALPPLGGLAEAAVDGRSLAYMATGPVCDNERGESFECQQEIEGNRAPERSETLAKRGPSGWASQDLTTPNETAGFGVRSGERREYRAFSPTLEEALVEPVSADLLSSEATGADIYVRSNPRCAAEPASATSLSCYTPLVSNENDTAHVVFEPSGEAENARGATPDLKHVIFFSHQRLVAAAKGAALYEWSAGKPPSETLTLVSLLPTDEGGGQAPPPLGLGGGNFPEMHTSAISSDGSHVVWRVGAEGPGALYQTDTSSGESVRVDGPNSDAPALEPAAHEPLPDFKTASTDGSKVFFTDTRRLTGDSTGNEAALVPPRNLYVFEASKPAGQRVTDLSKDLNVGESAEVLGAVSASDDGTLVYFVANGVLAKGARPGDCRSGAPAAAGCNLYVAHETDGAWSVSWIAQLSSGDNPDWGAPPAGNPGERGSFTAVNTTSRVSPDGQYFAFMSSRPLTGYDNSDASSGVPDEEVFLYKYEGPGARNIACASCNPNGSRPSGVLDTPNAGEGLGLVMDRPETWSTLEFGTDHWLAANIPGWTSFGDYEALYQSRYLSNSGRLFFNSVDPLVARDKNGKSDVYEYEPSGVGGCTGAAGSCVSLISSGGDPSGSAFLDASESGNDVFFVTNAKLTLNDPDTSSDVYDARVCGVAGTEPCPPEETISSPTECGGEGCKHAPTPQPTYSAPPSTAASGNGAPPVTEVEAAKVVKKPLTRAQKLAAALKKCHKLKQHGKRAACEKHARKLYGAKKASAKKANDNKAGGEGDR